MGTTVQELLYLFVEDHYQEVAIFDLASDNFVFEGVITNVPEELEDLEIKSIDNLDDDSVLTINVDTGEE